MSRISKLYHTAEGKAAALMAKPLENSTNPKHWKATEIQPNLWLGDVRSAHLHKIMKDKGITHIVQILNHVEPPFPEEFKYKVIDVNDCPEEDLFEHYDAAIKFMRDAIVSGGGVFAHCMKGKSRSASMMAAYLMAENGWSKEQALGYIKGKRNKINLIPQWEAALDRYQVELERRRQTKASVGSPSSRILNDHGSAIAGRLQASPALSRREKRNSDASLTSPLIMRKAKDKGSSAMSPDTSRHSWRKAEQPDTMLPMLINSPHMSRINRNPAPAFNTAYSPDTARVTRETINNGSPDTARRSNWTKAKSPDSRHSWRKAEQPGNMSPMLINSPHVSRIIQRKNSSSPSSSPRQSWRKAEQPGSSSNLKESQEKFLQQDVLPPSLAVQSPHMSRIAHKKTNSNGISPVGSPSMSRLRRV